MLALSWPSGSANIEVTGGLSTQLTGVARLFTDVPYFCPACGIRIPAALPTTGIGFFAYTNGRAFVRYARSLKD